MRQKKLCSTQTPWREFANLKPAGVDGFRERHRDFAPASWWEYQSDSAARQGFSKHWQLSQSLIRKAWEEWYPEERELLLWLILIEITKLISL